MSETPVILMHDHVPASSDLSNMLKGGVTAKVLFFSVDVEIGGSYVLSARSETGWHQKAKKRLAAALRDIDSTEGRAVLATQVADVVRAKLRGQVAVLLGSEGAKLLEGRIEPLEEFYSSGLRVLQLAWACPNSLLDGDGLSGFGRLVIRTCNEMGIIVDLTHLPERAFQQSLDETDSPVIVSHCAAARVTTDLCDERIAAIAENGGVMGVHFYRTYLIPPERGTRSAPTVSDLVRQVDHFAEVGGVEHVGLGGDFFPRSRRWRQFQRAQGVAEMRWAIPSSAHVPRIASALEDRGYSSRDRSNILGGNFLRLCGHVFR